MECVRPIFEELGPQDCLDLLRDEPVGHVALNQRALPVVVPVNFAVLDGDIVWRSDESTRLSDASVDFVVAFEVDHYEPGYTQGWSVMVQGLAHVVTDDEELDLARGLTLESWATSAPPDRYIRLVPNLVTGTRIRQASSN